jgi:hypothetical protein
VCAFDDDPHSGSVDLMNLKSNEISQHGIFAEHDASRRTPYHRGGVIRLPEHREGRPLQRRDGVANAETHAKVYRSEDAPKSRFIQSFVM